MAYDNRPNLKDGQFSQASGDTMHYYGTNIICRASGAASGGIIDSYTGYQISGVTIFDTGIAPSAIQIGCNANAGGVASTVIGAASMGSGATSIAIGCNSKACGTASISIGTLSQSRGLNSIAIGEVIATKANSIAIGYNICSDNIGSIGIGCNTMACGNCAYVMGNYITNYSGCSFGLGWYAGAGQQMPSILFSNTKSYFYGCGDPKIAVGCCNPQARIDIYTSSTPAFRLVDGNQGLGKIFTSDANGYATWCSAPVDSTTANNGLTKSGLNVHLGGDLTGNTTITGGYTLSFCSGAKLNTKEGYQISGTTMFRAATSSLSSIYVGQLAGNNGSIGTNNIAIGSCALCTSSNANANIAIGFNSLSKNNGSCNIALGYAALSANTTGFNNIAIGTCALRANTSSPINIAIGCKALYSNTTGSGNIAMGVDTLFSNICGCYNVALGIQALIFNTCGCWNTGVGFCSLQSNTSGSTNTAIGYHAGVSNTIGSNNVFIGRCAGFGFTTTSNKLHIANCSSCTLIYGDFVNQTVQVPYLILSGTPALGSIVTDCVLVWNPSDNCVKQMPTSSFGSGGGTITGATNGLSVTGKKIKLGGLLTGNTLICGAYNVNVCNGSLGTKYGYQISGTTMFRTGFDLSNIFIGQATGGNTTGYNNIALGGSSLQNNTTGNGNTAIGNGTLVSNTIGISNTAVGFAALQVNVSGNFNVGVGAGSLTNNTIGCSNVAIGNATLDLNTTGCENVAVGTGALASNVTGKKNVALGYDSLCGNSGGTCNVGIGSFAGFLNVNGNNNLFIGTCAGYSETGSGKLYISNNATTSLIYGDFTTPMVKICGELCTTSNVCVGSNIYMTTGGARCVYMGVTTSTTYPLTIFGQCYGAAGTTGSAGSVIISGGTAGSSGTGVNAGGAVYLTGGFGCNTTVAQYGLGGNAYVCGGRGCGVSAIGCGGQVCIVGGFGTAVCGNVCIFSGAQLRLNTLSTGVCITGALTTSSTICATSDMCATNFILTSDERLKTCIQPIPLTPICSEYKQFEMIAEPNQLRYGVIAQELQKENPELVRTNENGMLSVAYIDLLVKEIAYLKYKINELEKRIG